MNCGVLVCYAKCHFQFYGDGDDHVHEDDGYNDYGYDAHPPLCDHA